MWVTPQSTTKVPSLRSGDGDRDPHLGHRGGSNFHHLNLSPSPRTHQAKSTDQQTEHERSEALRTNLTATDRILHQKILRKLP
jgi:hypothetical protein